LTDNILRLRRLSAAARLFERGQDCGRPLKIGTPNVACMKVIIFAKQG
jgi:hypothetical protein